VIRAEFKPHDPSGRVVGDCSFVRLCNHHDQHVSLSSSICNRYNKTIILSIGTSTVWAHTIQLPFWIYAADTVVYSLGISSI